MSPPTNRRARVAAAALLLLAGARAHAPHDVLTELAISPAFATDQTLFGTVFLTDNALFVRSTDAGRSWRYFGTPMAEFGPRHFVFSPDFLDDRTAFAATIGGGVWRTTDGGDTWQTSNAGLTTLSVRDIAVSPDFEFDHRVIVATGLGVFLSNDGGDTWAPSSTGLSEMSIQRVAMQRASGDELVAFAVGSAFHVADGSCTNWLPKGAFPSPVESLSVSPSFADDRSIAVAFGTFGQGVALSQDGGASFSWVNTGLTDLSVMEVELAADHAAFAVTAGGGCYRALVAGGSWTLKTKDFEKLSPLTTIHNTEVVTSPGIATDGVVFVGGFEGTYRSEDHADNWLQLDIYSQRLNRRFVLSTQFASDRQLLAGNYGGGVFHYAEQDPLPGFGSSGLPGGSPLAAGATPGVSAGSALLPGSSGAAPFAWEARSADLTTPWSATLAASPGETGQRQLLYGYSNLFQSRNEGLSWTGANKPAAVDVVRAIGFSPDFLTDDTVFIGSGTGGSYRSIDACSSWQTIAGLPSSLSTTSIAVSPGWSADGTVFFASRNLGLWRSTDFGWNWAQLTQGLSSVAAKAVVLSPDFVLDRFAVAGYFGSGLFTSNDGGDTWSEANTGLPTGETLRVESVAFSPGFPHDHTLFVALQNQGVWRSTDGAASWQPTGPGLPAPPVEVALSPTFPLDRTLFVGTFGGTCVSRDAGASWQMLPGYVRADDGHPAVLYSGSSWKAVASPGDIGAACRQAKLVGEATWLDFDGRSIAWYGDTAPDGALVWITLDGGLAEIVDTASASVQHGVMLWHHNFPTTGPHVVRVTHAGFSGPPGGDHLLRSDGFAYEW